jgi:hypothetical protein
VTRPPLERAVVLDVAVVWTKKPMRIIAVLLMPL